MLLFGNAELDVKEIIFEYCKEFILDDDIVHSLMVNSNF